VRTRRPELRRASPDGGLRRSVELFRAFRVEQTDPERFYGLLARDSVALVSRHQELSGARVLDVGAGPGYFGDAFRGAGASYLSVDSDLAELRSRVEPGRDAILGLGQHLPIHDASVDVAFSSNLLEHVRDPFAVWEELIRVARPGGYVVTAFTNWLSPWGGHETSPWHYLGGNRAAVRYEQQHHRPAKNRYGQSLFDLSVRDALHWVEHRTDLEVVEARPRYLPEWARGLVRVPGVRELATWNLFVVARRL
jgi:SAM-dependent methyltransferase